MTNFTRDVKRELLTSQVKDDVLFYAFSAVIATDGSSLDGQEFTLISGNERVFEYFLQICERLNVAVSLKNAMLDPKSSQDRLTFLLNGESVREHYVLPPTPDEEKKAFQNRALAYLRAAFLGGGSCTLPRDGAKTGYHLEFQFFDRNVASRFCEMLDGLELFGREHVRGKGGRYVVYLSSREAISDFLSVVGARSALKKLENVSFEREKSNRRNRVNNCFIGNADKTAIASAERIVVLRQMQEQKLLDELDAPLREAAEYRIEYPTLSLAELAQKMGISKSCLNHRMRKLMKIYSDNTHD